MFRIHVSISERAILHVNGVPRRWLGPGRHLVWMPFSKLDVVRFQVDKLLADLRPEQVALAPDGALKVLTIQTFERGVVHAQGKPALWLKPGRHVLFMSDPAITVEILDTRGVETTPLDPEVRKLAPTADYVETTVPQGCVALRHVDGVLTAVLPPGRHAAWTTQHQVNTPVLDLRERIVHINGQDVMTKDRVSLRLNVAITFRLVDPRKMAAAAQNADDALYLAAQLSTRDAVTSRTLDGLLAGRDTVGQELLAAVKDRAAALGLEVLGLGIRDVILPGEMKDLLNKVMEAQKAAEANVISRREEIAATRSMAQTAAVLAEHPVLMRLKELEAYKELAAKVGNVHVVLGEKALPSLQFKGD